MGQPHKQKILVVEDNEPNVMLVSMCLQELGYPYDIAEDSEQALDKVEHNDYGLILMDINMPGRDGIETTRIIRSREIQDGGHDSIPIIALTTDGDKERCLEAGMDDYLLKPITLPVLKARIEEHVI